jgi:UDP-N-acetyl-D-glucosamine dehydrogenase
MKLNQRTVAIIGQGYVGLPLAMAAAQAGWRVIGVDIDEKKIQSLNNGLSFIEDVKDYELQNAINIGLYIATSNISEVNKADVIIICVPTPLNKNKEPDIYALRTAVESIAPHVENETLIISESTSYPGTLRNEIIPLFEQNRKKVDLNTYFAVSPERVNPGDKEWNQKNTPRLIGGINKESEIRAMKFYETFCNSITLVDTPEIAEAAKLLENTFRLVNIGFINEFAQLCNASDIEINKVIDAASTKPYGFMTFRPGIGIGGHCIPVDPLYLTWWAKTKESKTPIVELTEKTNSEMYKYIWDRAKKIIREEKAQFRILLLGVAYKSGLSDTRETPAKSLYSYLIELGHEVAWIDPLVKSWEGIPHASDVKNFDVAILTINQAGLPIDQLLNEQTPILDCTNTYSKKEGIQSL